MPPARFPDRSARPSRRRWTGAALAALMPVATLATEALGQSSAAGQPPRPPPAEAWSALWWALGVVAALVLLAGIWLAARRFAQGGSAPVSEGLSLESLRRMRDQGTLSPEEFERTKAVIVSRQLEALKAAEARKARRQEKP